MNREKKLVSQYKRPVIGKIGDFFYAVRRRISLCFTRERGVKLRSSFKRNRRIFLFAMLTIPVLHWLVFWLYVNINSILLAFQTNAGAWSLVQFDILFENLFSAADSTIGIALKNTLLYFSNSIFIILPLALLLSYFFYKRIFMYKTLRVVLYLPAIISAVAMTAVYMNFIKDDGPLGYLLKAIGFEQAPQLLADSKYATPTIIFYCTWTGTGTSTLLFSGAMARIPVEVTEAAKVDGCGYFRELFVIVLPLIWSTICTQLMLTMTGLFTSSGPILLFTKGAARTTTIAYWIFDQVYTYNSYNNVSAAGLFFTCIGVPIILTIRWLLDRVPKAEY